jgi:outer membrane protein
MKFSNAKSSTYPKVISLTLLIVFLFSSLAVAEPVVLSIDDAIKMAVESNSSLKNAERTSRLYNERIREYWGGAYPSIDVTATYTRNLEKPLFFLGGSKVEIGSDNDYTAIAELNQVLWAGGKVRTGIKMADLYSESATQQYRQVRSEIIRSTRNLCYAILLADATLKIQEENLNMAKHHLAQIQAKFKQGLESDLALMRQKVEVANLEPAVIEAKNLYQVGLLNLKSLLGKDPEWEMVLDGDLNSLIDSTSDLLALYKVAEENRPELHIAKLNYEISGEKIKLEKSGFYPSLYAFANRTFSGQSDKGFPDENQRYWSSAVGARLTLSIFSGGATRSRVRQAKIEREQAEEILVETQRNVRIDVKKNWLDFMQAKERVLSQEQSVNQARKVVNATEARFKNGLASQLELNDVSLALNKSQLLYVQALHDAGVSLANLNWAVGK